MRKIELTKKTGFRVNDIYSPIVIRDFRGIMFYSTEPILPKVKYFNLPAGEYLVDTGYFSQMEKPVKYNLIRLPLLQRLYPKPSDFTICFGSNPNKCTIMWDEKFIIFDNSFREKPLPQLFFILYHEFGHHRYRTERFADLYAANCMLVKGFNIFQIAEAPILSLSNNAQARKEFLLNKLLEANNL